MDSWSVRTVLTVRTDNKDGMESGGKKESTGGKIKTGQEWPKDSGHFRKYFGENHFLAW